ncbi:hypothetical protein GCM10027053_50650 [Intrasporangium mesophilum]
MPRPATSRRALVAALACAAMLTACTGNVDDGSNGSGASATPVIAPQEASATATSAVSAAASASLDSTAAGAAARAQAYSGAALESANAYAKTLAGRTPAEKAAAELATQGAKVLAVSREGDTPRLILVQATLKKSGAPVLVLLTSSERGAPFKVAAQTPMLPGATLDALDPTTDGSAAVAGAKGLVAEPDEVTAAFAQAVKYPDPTSSKLLAADPLSEQLRESAKAQAQALNSQGAFTQEHEPKGVIGGLRLKDGSGAVVFVQLVRDDAIAMRTPVKLTPAKDLTLLTGIKRITTEANLTSNEIIAIVIPASGQARVIAASDQLIAGSGR